MKIQVNTREVEVDPVAFGDALLTYVEIIKMAGYGQYENPSVTWRSRDGETGTMKPDEKIWAEAGMAFDVTYHVAAT